MTDQQQETKPTTGNDGATTTGADTQPTTGRTEISSLPPDMQKYIEDLRHEAEKYRKSLRVAEQASKAAEEKRLADNAEWQKLAEARAAELEKLKPVAEQHEAITTAFNASLDNRLKQIPDDIRKKTVDPIRAALSPVAFSEWLDANLDILRARQAPNLDGGAQGTAGRVTVTLTAEQRAMAEATGMTPEQYMKAMQAIEQQRGTEPPKLRET